MLDCHSNTVKFFNNSSTNYGNLYYLWDFGDGIISYDKDPSHIFATSGLHEVKLTVFNNPSSCTDTLIRTVESFSPPLVGITGDRLIAPVKKQPFLHMELQFTFGVMVPKQDQLVIGAPGGEFWMVGKSTTGCFSDTLRFEIEEEPDWQFEIEGDNSICEGDTVELKADNAVSYKWNTSDTTSLIWVSKEGKYTVTGLNLRGCEKQDEIFIKVNPIPSVDFTYEPKNITKDQNKLRVSIPQENSVEYYWNFGDGSTGTGHELHHEFNVTGNPVGLFNVKLIAVSKASCSDTLSKIVVIYPTIPDIFTPDNDGFNDRWKVNLSEYFDNGIIAAIFDRWGEKLIEWKNVRELSWDGRFKGVISQSGSICLCDKM